jgi:hypothetical protein
MAYSFDSSQDPTYSEDGLTPAQRRARQVAQQSNQIDAQNTVDPSYYGAETGPNPVSPDPTPTYSPITNFRLGADDPETPQPYDPTQWSYGNDNVMTQVQPDPPPAPPPTPTVTPPTTPTGDIPPPNVTPPPPNASVTGGDPVPQTQQDWQADISGFNQNQFQPAQLPTTDLPIYQPQQLMTPDALNAEQLQFGLLQKVLNAPDEYTEENVRQMQEAQKEQALSAQHGAMQKLTDRYAAMGRYGSGQLDANSRRMQDDTTSQILSGNRDINLQAANANWNSRMSALQNANSVLNESLGRRQAQANQEYLGYNSQADQTKFALERALGQAGLGNQANSQNLQSQQLALQSALGTGGLSLDKYKTDLSNNLNWYQSLSSNDNFLKQLLANLGMFNASQTNSTFNNL